MTTDYTPAGRHITRKAAGRTKTEAKKWLKIKSQTLSTRTLHALYSALNRTVKRAMAREKVKRNGVEIPDLSRASLPG